MDKEVVVQMYNGILLSYKKECIWVSSNEVGESGAYHMEWSKSEREKQTLYIKAYIWNLERQQSWMQGSKGDTDVKNRLSDSVGEGKGGITWENSIEMCTLSQKIDNQCKFDAWRRAPKADALGQHRGIGWEGGGSGV